MVVAESDKKRPIDSNLIIVGMMVLLAVAMLLFAIIAIAALRRRTSGQLWFS